MKTTFHILRARHRFARRWPVILSLFLASAGQPGCKPLKTGAKEQFAKEHSCPEERVEVRARTDLRWSVVVGVPGSESSPPAEVQKDPERLAKWRKDRAEEQRKTRARLDDVDVFEARGCGHSQLLGCWHPGNEEGHMQTNEVSCQIRDYPPGIKPW